MAEALSKILIIGKGAREHALGWKIRSQSPDTQLFFAPGNAGTELLGTNLSIMDIPETTRWARNNNIDLTIVGPEDPIAEGVADSFNAEGLTIFAPSKKAAQLESSKDFAIAFMERHNIPHADSRSFEDAEKALEFIGNCPWSGIVVKADGRAGGKGVFVTNSQEEAIKAIDDIMNRKIFGEAGSKIVLQEKLSGPEISVLAFTDGETVVAMRAARDYKRLLAQDEGPNTGGMGAIVPPPDVTTQLMQTIQEKILQSTIDGMQQEGVPFVGILFAGIMLTDSGPKVLEYNARFGDPETQALMMLLESDLISILLACIHGVLNQDLVRWSDETAACVVLASEGYPHDSVEEVPIYGLGEIPEGINVFHGATRKIGNGVVTHQGRILTIAAKNPTLKGALEKVYGAIGENGINFNGMQFRRDIGAK